MPREISNRLSLLIVDDSARMRATIRSILAQVPLEVVGECDNGLDALKEYERLRPDWVLMDVSMPGLDGISALQRIRDMDPNAKVIIVTDYADAALKKAAAEAGAIGYVRKDDLMSVLEIIG